VCPACDGKVAADIVNVAVKKLVELFVEGAKVLDLCVEGDKLIEEGTGAVYNKSVKGVKVSKGSSLLQKTNPLSTFRIMNG
jgi:methionine aminopeptidase